MQQVMKLMLTSVAAIGVMTGVAVAEEDAAHPLAFMFGEWVGPASGVSQAGPFSLTQTERVGPMLDGDAVVIEGRGYDDDGNTVFNALGIVSPTATDDGWEMRTYANGRTGTFPFEITDTGYVWSLPAGPGARMVYTATFDGNSWHQTGAYTPTEGPARQTFEMALTRTGDSDWPAADPVSHGLE